MRTRLIAAGLIVVASYSLPAVAHAQSLSGLAPEDAAAGNTGPLPQSGAAAGANAENPPVQTTGPTAPGAPLTEEGGIEGYFANWFNRVNEAQASQPHWMTPLVTVTPRLEEEVRYDQYWETQPTGASLHIYDDNKGVELIPTTTNEVIFTLPAYEEQQLGSNRPVTGWSDYPIFLIKQRLLSENEQHGNYILTAFLQLTAPTGSVHFTDNAWVVTPTIAGGKGWGNFDIQATSGVSIPVNYLNTNGAELLTNVTFQYHAFRYFWPEFELNDTIWLSGSARGGKDQLFFTPGLILGRFVLGGRVRASIGAGYQVALSPNERLVGPLLPTYDHNWLLSARLTF